MRNMMKASGLVSAALAAMVLLPAGAAEVGTVISSTPVMKRVTETPRGCKATAQSACELITEDRLIGYKVVYEYQGQQHQVQLPFAVGATIPIEVSGNSVAPAGTPTIGAPTPSYESGPRVVERVYIEPAYPRGRAYYDDPHYAAPVWPAVVGLTLGLGAAYYWGPRYYWPRGHVHFRGGGRWHR